MQRLLRAVDASSPRGLRGHALLLMMSTYGLGAGEAIRLQLQDIGWGAATLRVVRPKTGIASRCPFCRPWPRRWRSTCATAGRRTSHTGTCSCA